MSNYEKAIQIFGQPIEENYRFPTGEIAHIFFAPLTQWNWLLLYNIKNFPCKISDDAYPAGKIPGHPELGDGYTVLLDVEVVEESN